MTNDDRPAEPEGRPSGPASWLRIAHGVLLGLYVVNGLFILYVIWRYLNILQIDAAGHIASAYTFRQGYFHRFYDGFFLGSVQNLFYPPLEDALLAGISLLTGGDMVLAHKIYLSVLSIAYLGAVVALATVFRRRGARLYFLAVMLWVLNMEKTGLTYFQGLSFVDLLVTGLSSEVLSSVFLLLLLRELLAGRDTVRITVWLTLALLSHLVAGPVAMLVTILYAVVDRRRYLVRHLVFALGITTFFLLPLVVAKEQIFTSTIYRPYPYFAVVLLVYAALLLRDRAILPIPLAGLLLVLPEEIHRPLAEGLGLEIFPGYHYYRLAIFSLIILAIAAAWLLDHPPADRLHRHFAVATVILAAFFLVRDFDLHRYPLGSESYYRPRLPPSLDGVDLPAASELRRVFVIHAERPCDFYVGSLFVARGQEVRFSKGLYWESSRNNVLLTSYLATLLDTSALVLDYWYFSSLTCSEMKCFFDHLVRDYNLGWIVLAESPGAGYLDRAKRHCYQRLFTNGSDHFLFERRSRFTLADAQYALYEIRPRTGLVSQEMVEVVDPRLLRRLDTDEPWYFSKILNGIRAGCRDYEIHREVYLYDEHFDDLWERLQAASRGDAPVPAAAVATTCEPIDRATYRLTIDAPQPVLFKIKLNYYPGFELRDAEGRALRLYDGAGYMLAIGNGEMILRYRRTGAMKVGYGISLLAAVAFLASLLNAARLGWRGRRP